MPNFTLPIAILSDIHANLEALQVVLTDMRSMEVETALCLGDTVGYGPDPAACLDLVAEHCVASILGNHEAMLLMLDEFPKGSYSEVVLDPLHLAHEQLSHKQLQHVGNLPLGIDLDTFQIIHSSHHQSSEFHYIDSHEAAADNFASQKQPVSFHGHTHVPAIWEKAESGKICCYAPQHQPVHLDPARQYAINVGSVGQPRDRNSQASYAIYDPSTGTLLHRRLAYDIKKAQARFRSANLPKFNATRIAKGK